MKNKLLIAFVIFMGCSLCMSRVAYCAEVEHSSRRAFESINGKWTGHYCSGQGSLTTTSYGMDFFCAIDLSAYTDSCFYLFQNNTTDGAKNPCRQYMLRHINFSATNAIPNIVNTGLRVTSFYCKEKTSNWYLFNDSIGASADLSSFYSETPWQNYKTDIPVFDSLSDARAYFVEGDTSKCINYQDVLGSLPSVYDTTFPIIDNLRWKIDNDSYRTNPYATSGSSQYDDYGYLSWDINNPNNLNLDYDVNTKCDGMYNMFNDLENGRKANALFHSDWQNALTGGYTGSTSHSPYHYLDLSARRYYTSMSIAETETMPYIDENGESLSGVNLQGFKIETMFFRVRCKVVTTTGVTYGGWSVASYNIKDNSFHVYDVGNTDNVSSSNETGNGSYDSKANKWIDDTNSKYQYTPDTSNILSQIKAGFGLFGDNGLISMLSATFTFIPKEFFTLLLTGIGIMVTIAIFKFLRG